MVCSGGSVEAVRGIRVFWVVMEHEGVGLIWVGESNYLQLKGKDRVQSLGILVSVGLIESLLKEKITLVPLRGLDMVVSGSGLGRDWTPRFIQSENKDSKI